MPKRKREEEEIQKLEKKIEKYKRRLESKDDQVSEELEQPDPFIIPEEEECLVENYIVEDMLAEALGEAPKEQEYGEEIHQNVASIMSKILLNGLSKEESEKIRDIKIPENCKLLDAPKLNPELLGILTPTVKSRDKIMQERQQALGQSAANIAQSIQMLTKKEFSKVEIMKKLGEASRVLCNIHFNYTELRRKLINPCLDKNLAESLKENKRSDNLFSDLEESVKSFSALKKASMAIKPKHPNNSKMVNTNANTKQPKNYNLPRRQYQNSSNKRGAYQQRPQRPYKPAERYQSGPSNRGRAKYP